jgi:corrinoid protein of di/trimethylamine methyltransferase
MGGQTKEQILKELADVVLSFDEEAVEGLCQLALDSGIDPNEAILDGLSKGMQVVGDLYDRQEYGIPEVLLCADTLNRGVDILRPHIVKRTSSQTKNCRIIIGTVEGDIHSIGKNIVKLMLGVDGFDVVDLGEDVPSQKVIEEIGKTSTDIVALSTMMTTTLASMKKIIDDVKQKYPQMKFLVGGASVTHETARKFGADGYGENATGAVEAARKIKTGL